MNTFLSSYAEDLTENWGEIELLIIKAKEHKETDQNFYSTLCRSIAVLMVAQLEGYTKNMLRSVIGDLNRNISFEEMPMAIKRTYCKKYIPTSDSPEGKNFNNRIEKLIEKFNELDCKITSEPFYISKNKNPSPYLLKTVFENLGIKDIFLCLNESIYDLAFSNTKSELNELLENLKSKVYEEVENFPYNHAENGCNLEAQKTSQRTLWEDFIERVNQRRHSIAHGNEFNNTVEVEELELDKLKIQIFEFASLRILTKYLMKNTNVQ